MRVFILVKKESDARGLKLRALTRTMRIFWGALFVNPEWHIYSISFPRCLDFQQILLSVPSIERVHMTSAVWTLLSGLCLSICVLGLLCCPLLFLLSVLFFLPLMLCVVECFDGWRIFIIKWKMKLLLNTTLIKFPTVPQKMANWICQCHFSFVKIFINLHNCITLTSKVLNIFVWCIVLEWPVNGFLCNFNDC